MKKYFIYSILFLLVLGTSCEKPEEPKVDNEEELITTLKLVMTNNADASDVATAVFKDTDGSGGNAPSQFDSIRLKPSAVYDVKVYVLNEAASPTDTINAEVEEEKNDHQFFYTTTGGLITPSYKTSADKDDNGVPLGINPTFTTGATTGIGSLKVTLKHQPDVKPKSGNGDINAGDTDIEVEFGYRIQ